MANIGNIIATTGTKTTIFNTNFEKDLNHINIQTIYFICFVGFQIIH